MSKPLVRKSSKIKHIGGYSDMERRLAFGISPILDELLKNNLMSDDFFIHVNFAKEGGIRQKVITGMFHETFRLPLMEVDLINLKSEKKCETLKGFIDTGASHTVVKKELLLNWGFEEKDFSLNENFHNVNGQSATQILNGIAVVSDKIDFHPIQFVLATDLPDFDIAIGNDVLQNCEFIYDGFSQSYVLKSYVIGGKIIR